MLTPAAIIDTISFVRDMRPREKKEREQERNWQQDDEDLRQLRQIKFGSANKPKLPVEKDRDIFADIEDQPDREKAGHAIEVSFQEIANDVSIEQSHGAIKDRVGVVFSSAWDLLSIFRFRSSRGHDKVSFRS